MLIHSIGLSAYTALKIAEGQKKENKMKKCVKFYAFCRKQV